MTEQQCLADKILAELPCELAAATSFKLDAKGSGLRKRSKMSSLETLIPGKNSLLYCPTPKQFGFHAGRGVYYERAALCGGGAGKTICGLAEDIGWALDYPGSVGVITEPSYPMVRLNIVPALESKYLLGCPFPFTRHPYVANFSRLEIGWIGRMVRSGGLGAGIILNLWKAQTLIIFT